jgi:hypothetical protein
MGKIILHMFILENSFLKIVSRTSKAISIKLDINHPQVKGIQNCTNQGAGSSQTGDNHKNTKMGLGHLKVFFSHEPQSQKILDLHKNFLI